MLGCVSSLPLGCQDFDTLLMEGETQFKIGVPAMFLWVKTAGAGTDVVVLILLCTQTLLPFSIMRFTRVLNLLQPYCLVAWSTARQKRAELLSPELERLQCVPAKPRHNSTLVKLNQMENLFNPEKKPVQNCHFFNVCSSGCGNNLSLILTNTYYYFSTFLWLKEMMTFQPQATVTQM